MGAILPGQRLANTTYDTKHTLLLPTKQGTQGLVPVAVAVALGIARAGGTPNSADAASVKGDGATATGEQRIPFYWVLPRHRYDVAKRANKPFPIVFRSAAAALAAAVSAGKAAGGDGAVAADNVLAGGSGRSPVAGSDGGPVAAKRKGKGDTAPAVGGGGVGAVDGTTTAGAGGKAAAQTSAAKRLSPEELLTPQQRDELEYYNVVPRWTHTLLPAPCE